MLYIITYKKLIFKSFFSLLKKAVKKIWTLTVHVFMYWIRITDNGLNSEPITTLYFRQTRWHVSNERVLILVISTWDVT